MILWRTAHFLTNCQKVKTFGRSRTFLISWGKNRDCHITMPLSLKGETFTAPWTRAEKLRTCLHGGEGPQVGKVTCLGGVKKISLLYMQSYNPAIPRGALSQDYWMIAKHVNKKNAGKPWVLAINALLQSVVALAATFRPGSDAELFMSRT